jgi:hypothetical protein
LVPLGTRNCPVIETIMPNAMRVMMSRERYIEHSAPTRNISHPRGSGVCSSELRGVTWLTSRSDIVYITVQLTESRTGFDRSKKMKP